MLQLLQPSFRHFFPQINPTVAPPRAQLGGSFSLCDAKHQGRDNQIISTPLHGRVHGAPQRDLSFVPSGGPLDLLERPNREAKPPLWILNREDPFGHFGFAFFEHPWICSPAPSSFTSLWSFWGAAPHPEPSGGGPPLHPRSRAEPVGSSCFPAGAGAYAITG